MIVRRVLLWGALGALVSVATHGLRDRIRRARQETAQLESRLRELTVLADRDRIARDIQDLVIKRLFAAGLSLQAAVSMTARGSVASRIESAIHDLDEAMRLIRQSIFGLRDGGRGGGGRESGRAGGLRQGILALCGQLTPAGGRAPEVTFSGPVDDAIPAATGQRLLHLLGDAFAVIGASGPAGQGRRHGRRWRARHGRGNPAPVAARRRGRKRRQPEQPRREQPGRERRRSERPGREQPRRERPAGNGAARNGPAGSSAAGNGPAGNSAGYARLRAMASQFGADIEIEEMPGGTRFAWHLPAG